MDESLTQLIETLFAVWDQDGSPGCAVGIIQHGQVQFSRGFGRANLEHNIPISSDTVFDVASLSKQFTGCCIALLAEEGILDFSDDVRKYLPELPELGHEVTIRHFLHHTSGWRDYLTLFELAGYRDVDYFDASQALEMLARQRALDFTPGDDFEYSNTGYFLLGVIVERITGQTLADFSHERIFAPLDMTHTWFQDDHTRIALGRATGYSRHEDGRYHTDMTTLEIIGDGTLFTSVDDLIAWDANFYKNRLGRGDQALIDLMTTTGYLNDGQSVDYGLGLELEPYRGLSCVSHSGSFVGYRAEILRFPVQELTIICLANTSALRTWRLSRDIADVLLSDEFPDASETGAQQLPTESESYLLSDDEIGRFAGDYFNVELNVTYKLWLVAGELWLQVARSAPALLRPDSDSDLRHADRTLRFAANGDENQFNCFTLDAGRPSGFQFVRQKS